MLKDEVVYHSSAYEDYGKQERMEREDWAELPDGDFHRLNGQVVGNYILEL